MGAWIPLVVALAPLLEQLLAFAEPEVLALLGKLNGAVANNPQHAANLALAASQVVAKLTTATPTAS